MIFVATLAPPSAGAPRLLGRKCPTRGLAHLPEKVLDGDAFTGGQVLEDVLSGVPVLLEQVRPAALVDTVRRSRWFHRRRVDAMQVVWPDTAARFGWQPGAEDEVRRAQPASWRVPAGRVGMLAPDPVWPLPTPPDAPAVACWHIVENGAWAAYVERFVIGGRDEWTVTCVDDIDHDVDAWPDEDDPSSGMVTTDLGHLVRTVPSLATLADLPDGGDAFRQTPDQSWYVSCGWGDGRPGGVAGQTGLNSPPPCHSAQETFQSP